MKTALLMVIMLSLYPFMRDGFTRLGKDITKLGKDIIGKNILLGMVYIIAGIIRLTRKIINLFKIGRK